MAKQIDIADHHETRAFVVGGPDDEGEFTFEVIRRNEAENVYVYPSRAEMIQLRDAITRLLEA